MTDAVHQPTNQSLCWLSVLLETESVLVHLDLFTFRWQFATQSFLQGFQALQYICRARTCGVREDLCWASKDVVAHLEHNCKHLQNGRAKVSGEQSGLHLNGQGNWPGWPLCDLSNQSVLAEKRNELRIIISINNVNLLSTKKEEWGFEARQDFPKLFPEPEPKGLSIYMLVWVVITLIKLPTSKILNPLTWVWGLPNLSSLKIRLPQKPGHKNNMLQVVSVSELSWWVSTYRINVLSTAILLRLQSIENKLELTSSLHAR